MQKCKIFQKRISSDLQLGKFPSWQRGKVEIRIARMDRKIPEKNLRWYHHVTDNNQHKFSSFARYQGGYFIRMTGTADFLIDRRGRWIEYSLIKNEKNMIAQILSFVIPFAITLAGAQVLHASAVNLPSGVAAFMGEQGMGKSTLAAAFFERGFSVLTDDALPLAKRKQGFFAIPSFPEIRLSKPTSIALLGKEHLQDVETAFRKKRLKINAQFAQGKFPLRTIYVLERSATSKVMIKAIAQREAWLFLLNNSYRIDPENRERMLKEALFLLALAEKISLRRLIYPRKLDFIPRVISKILSDQKH